MTKRASKPGSSKDQPHAELPSAELLAYQKVMRDALKPKLNAEQKGELMSVIERYAQRGVVANFKVKPLSKTVWWWQYVYGACDLGTLQKLTAEGEEMMRGFELTAEEIGTIKLANPRCYQFPAFVYEMAVRLMKSDLLHVPWIKLSADDQLPFLEILFRPNFLTGILTDGPLDEDSTEHWHWTRPVGNVIFNLLQSDTALLEAFGVTFVRSERRRLKIPSPTSNFGRQNKPFSWSAIEDFDLEHIEKRVLNDSQRSRLSKATKKVSSLLGIADAKISKKQSVPQNKKG